MKSNLVISVIVTLTITSVASAQSVWREDSFEAFRDGSFLDGGSNSYVSSKGRIQMITRWDFNNDGHLDIFLPGSHGHTERENTYIYLNNGDDIDGRSRIEIPGGGTRDGVIADFNKDGLNDLAVVNHTESHFRRVNSWIYYNTPDGFTVEERIDLSSPYGSAIAAGDFNGDSWLDLAIGCQWWEEGKEEGTTPKHSFIYWNSPRGFSQSNHFPTKFGNDGATALAAADIDHDGIDDLVALGDGKTYVLLSTGNAFRDVDNAQMLPIRASAVAIGDVNGDGELDIALCTKEGVEILPGSKRGKYTEKDRLALPVSWAIDVALSDLNKDGFDDIIVANFATPGGATWTESYIFYSDGNDFSKGETLALPTLGARGVTCDDINDDGYPEIVFSHERITNQQNLLSYIYWNDEGTFRFENHTQLPTQGTYANAIGDVNKDGLKDVVFFNDEGYFRDGPTQSHIYWGDGTRNFSRERTTEFQTHQIFGFGHADLDDDNHVDIVMAQKNFVNGVNHDQAGLIILWSDREGFDPPTHLTMTYGYGGVRIADINRDGFLDILAGGKCIDLDAPDRHGFPIFWGSELGYSTKNRTLLHYTADRFRVPLLMDLNKDGWLDIAGQVEDGKVRFWWGDMGGFSDDRFTDIDLGRQDHLMYIKGADLNKDGWLDLLFPKRAEPDGRETSSFIYYGSRDGYTIKNRTEVRSFVPYQNSIADLNQDGWLDLFLTSYGGEVTGNLPSLIYWGSKKGFRKKRTKLETYGSSGSETLDYDGDGWLDILITNHRQAGTNRIADPHHHITPSLLYWGGPDGYSENNRWETLAVGPSGLNPRDLGNSYDRGLYEDYISSVYSVPENEIPRTIGWEAETPYGTEVHFQIRVAENEAELASARWHGPAGADSWFTTSDTQIDDLTGGLIQYRARLITPNGAATPYLSTVTITFEKQ